MLQLRSVNCLNKDLSMYLLYGPILCLAVGFDFSSSAKKYIFFNFATTIDFYFIR